MTETGEELVERLIDGLIEREGGYLNHPADRGGPANFGITVSVARAHGYAGPMRDMPRSEAEAIYRRLYWLRPNLGPVARLSPAIAEELFDTGDGRGYRRPARRWPGRALQAVGRT